VPLDERKDILERVEKLRYAGLAPEAEIYYRDQLAFLRTFNDIRPPKTDSESTTATSESPTSATSTSDKVKSLYEKLTTKIPTYVEDQSTQANKLMQIRRIEDYSFEGLSQIEIRKVKKIRNSLENAILKVAQLEAMLKPDMSAKARHEILDEMIRLANAGMSAEAQDYFVGQCVNLEICESLGDPSDYSNILFVKGMSERDYAGLKERQKKKIAEFLKKAEIIKAEHLKQIKKE
jgi:hypothetical protein